MTESVAVLSDESVLNLACFEVSGQEYALEVVHLREIVRCMPITPLPDAPSLIEGVIDLRGSVVPVLDLGKVLRRGPVEIGPQARIVVLETQGLVLGLCVDAVTDVLALDRSELDPVPPLATQAGYDAVRHIVRRAEAAPVMVLSLEHLVTNVQRSASRESMQAEGST